MQRPSEKELLNALNNEEKQGDKDIRQCKVCKEFKVRIRAGKYPNGKDTKFTSEEGLLWNGRQCPQCQVSKMANHMKSKRNP